MTNFSVGDLVTLKTHPLLHDFYIKGDGKLVPPIMIIKEVLFEGKEKKTNDEITGFVIGEKIKYVCVHFDDNRSEFIESHLYHSMLDTYRNLNIAFLGSAPSDENHIDLITEVGNYPPRATYAYGELLYFKTKKLEIFKKRTSNKIILDDTVVPPLMHKKKKIIQYVVNYSTPDFLACGYKKETSADLFYNDGKPKKMISTEFVKVKWFNSFQQKFSEQYLPIEFFINTKPFN